MANSERLESLAAWARAGGTRLHAERAAARGPDALRRVFGDADAFLVRLRAERKEAAAELRDVQRRIADGRPPRQHHSTWARVAAELLADAVLYEQALESLDAQIQEQERFGKQLRTELARPAQVAQPARVNAPQQAVPSPVAAAPVLRRLPRMALWVGGGLFGVLVLCIVIVSAPGAKDAATPTAMLTPRLAPATEAADLWTPAPRVTAAVGAVRRKSAATEAAAPAEVEAAPATLQAEPPTAPPAPSATPLPAPTDLPLPVAAKDANLRGGPGTNYPVVGGLKTGATLDIVERTSQGDWYRLASGGWIAAFLVANAPAGVPVALTIPPTPRPRPSATPVPMRVVPVPTAVPQPVFSGCCKVCTTGQACGNSCISRSKQCHQPPGCACQG